MGDGFRIGSGNVVVDGVSVMTGAVGAGVMGAYYQESARKRKEYRHQAKEANELSTASKRLLDLVNGDRGDASHLELFEKVFPSDRINARLAKLTDEQEKLTSKEISAYFSGLEVEAIPAQLKIVADYKAMIDSRSWNWDVTRGEDRLMLEVIFKTPRLMQVVTGVGPDKAEQMLYPPLGSLAERFFTNEIDRADEKASFAELDFKSMDRLCKFEGALAGGAAVFTLWMLADLVSIQYFNGRNTAQVLNDTEK